MPADEAVASLESLGFGVQARDAASVTVSVPSWRNDIAAKPALDQAPGLAPVRAEAAAAGAAAIEPECDLIEEVLRLRGLDAVPAVSLPRSAPVPGATITPRQSRSAVVRRTLAAQGLAECVSFSFMAQADAVLRAARGAERNLIAGVSLFDVYDGDKLPVGKKSLAIEVVFQPRERTLTDAEIDAAAAKVVAAVAKATGASLRG